MIKDADDKVNIQPNKAFRIGNLVENQQRPRLLKVQFKKESDAQWIIFNYKKLKFQNNIKCWADKTLYQRQLYKNAQIELRNKEENGQKNLMIKYKNNIPTVVEESVNNNTTRGNSTSNKNTFHQY